jgi:plasmid stabilization system protein ParE
VTRQRTKGYTWNQHIAELRHAHNAIRQALKDIVRHPDMSRAMRAELVSGAALMLSEAQEAVQALEDIAGQTHDELLTLERKIQVVK